MRELVATWRRLAHPRASRGIAALEFGLLTPLFMMLLAAVVDFANAYTAKSLLDATVASTANYVLLNTGALDATTLGTNAAKLVGNSNSNDHWFNGTVVVNNGVTVTVTSGATSATGNANTSCYCPTGATTALTWGAAVTCGSTCAGGSLAGTFVQITATYVYVPIFAGYTFLPNGTMTSSTIVQTQ